MIIQGVTLNGTRVVDASFITSGLVLSLDANQSASYSGSGTTVNDLSGNGYAHSLSSAGLYTMLNGVKCFDCTTTGVVTANALTCIIPTNFTYVSWARIITSSSGYRTLLRTQNAGHPIIISQGTNLLGMWDNTTATGFNSSGYNMSSYGAVWAQWATVGTAAGQTFYINGQKVGSNVNKSDSGKIHYAWGNIHSAVDQPWGHVANLQLYNFNLTEEQIRQNYYNQLPIFQLPNIVTSNLVLWYDPSFNTSYPGSGGTITNLANTSLAGTLTNITYTSPYFSYNGTSSQVAIADNALLEPGSGDWTMEAWFRPSLFGTSGVILGKFDNGGGSQDVSYSIRINAGGSLFAQLGSGSGSGATLFVNSTSYQTTVNTWYQVVYVFKNGATKTLETFINGTSIGTVNHSLSSILNTTNNLYIGSYNNGEYAQWFNGRIGVTRLYNTALSAADVLQNFNADKAKYGL